MDLDPAFVTLAHDPQTSGGLLAAVPERCLDPVLEDLNAAGVSAWRIGHVETGEGSSSDRRAWTGSPRRRVQRSGGSP